MCKKLCITRLYVPRFWYEILVPVLMWTVENVGRVQWAKHIGLGNALLRLRWEFNDLS